MSTTTNGRSNSQSVVLVAVDLSPASAAVLTEAASIGRGAPVKLHVVHVLPMPPADNIGFSPADRQLALESLADRARRQLHQLLAEVAPPIARAVLHVRAGTPELEIAQLASDLGADLLVVGTHARTGVERLVIGSVAESLVRNAPCPVLTYRPKAAPSSQQIAPPCADCQAVQRESGGTRLWCERHSEHHPRAHTYSLVPESFAVGSQTFR